MITAIPKRLTLSLRTLIAAVSLICVTLGLLTISTPNAAVVSGLLFLTLLIAAACLAIGDRQPNKAFGAAFTVTSLGIFLAGYWENSDLATLRQRLALQTSRPIYGFMHSDTPTQYPQLYWYGSQIRESVYDAAGNYKGWAGRTARQVELRGIDPMALPAIPRYEEFAEILIHTTAIFIGWLAACWAYRLRCGVVDGKS